MALFYDENKKFEDGPIDLKRMNATRQYLKHYENYVLLGLYLKEGTRQERHDASKELEVCERKMAFWRRQKNYDSAKALVGMEKTKLQWGGRFPWDADEETTR